MSRFIKDSNATLDYTVDWSAWLATGDTISSSTWTVTAGVTKSNESSTTTTATAFIAGGTTGGVYTLTNRIVTAQGRTDDRSITLTIQDK